MAPEKRRIWVPSDGLQIGNCRSLLPTCSLDKRRFEQWNRPKADVR
jgi:hypothetical protein